MEPSLEDDATAIPSSVVWD